MDEADEILFDIIGKESAILNGFYLLIVSQTEGKNYDLKDSSVVHLDLSQ